MNLMNDPFRIDTVGAGALEAGDLIKIDNEIVTINSIKLVDEGYLVEFENDYGEKDEFVVDDGDVFNLYMFD